MAYQVVVFAENRPGRLEKITGVLAEAGINIRAITIASSDRFGVVKLLVDRPTDAVARLKEAGLSASLQEVLALPMEDRPGGLHKVLQVFADKGINLRDAYGFVEESGRRAILVVEVDDLEGAERSLADDRLYSL
ncbi:MAG TPA: ACT domain-containing protein [Candidatus Latescibacteria bacterium]|nr:ACT domain-containing protein [Candidatus Latescibacterota bacterium]